MTHKRLHRGQRRVRAPRDAIVQTVSLKTIEAGSAQIHLSKIGNEISLSARVHTTGSPTSQIRYQPTVEWEMVLSPEHADAMTASLARELGYDVREELALFDREQRRLARLYAQRKTRGILICAVSDSRARGVTGSICVRMIVAQQILAWMAEHCGWDLER